MDGKSYTIHQGKQSQTTSSQSSRAKLRKSLDGISYRIETVAEVGGVEFINDTKAIDLLTTRDSFKCLIKPAIWLTTTTSFERDFALIEKLISEKIKAIVVYGNDSSDMQNKLEKLVDAFVSVPRLGEAVRKSFELSETDECVIYSPSCVVEDGYLNFADRSRAFEKFISTLEGK